MPPERPQFTEAQVNSVISVVSTVKKDNPILSGQIRRICSLKSLFHLTDIVHHVRDQLDLPLCSSNQGYWWGTQSDCREVAESLERRAVAMIDAAKGLRRAALKVGTNEPPPNQLELL